jgi:hypothetical protein
MCGKDLSGVIDSLAGFEWFDLAVLALIIAVSTVMNDY